MLNFANGAAPFNYNASGTLPALFFLFPSRTRTRLAVVLTNSSVTDDLYPVGSKAVLGYGINGPTSPPNASLIPTFLPCVGALYLGIGIHVRTARILRSRSAASS